MQYINFGLYPQRKKAANVSIGTERTPFMYYIGSDGCMYEKVGSDYFKVEPIVWEVREGKNGTRLLISRDILDVKEFDSEKNYYADSDVRKWINRDFIYKSFTEQESDSIIKDTVDNGASSVLKSDNEYVCEDTNDKIFLLSIKEIVEFSKEERKRPVSDYALAKGASKVEQAECMKDGRACGWWLSRSPDSLDENFIDIVDADGSINWAPVNDDLYGIVPALRIH